MLRIKVCAEALEPLVIGDGLNSSQNTRATLDHIPGGTVRGAIAQLVLERLGNHRTSNRTLGGASDSLSTLFDQMFPRVGGPSFGFLYPGKEYVIPCPATSWRCRNDTSHLFDRLVHLLKGIRVEPICPECQGRLERARGYLEELNGKWQSVKLPAKRSFVKVGLNRGTEAAEDRFLYVVESLQPAVFKDSAEIEIEPLRFLGYWWFESEEQWEKLLSLLGDVVAISDDSCILRIGSARTRGFGKIRLSWERHDVQTVDTDVFNNLTREPESDKMCFTLMLRTPLLAYDMNGQPASTLSPEILRDYVPTLPPSVQLVPQGTLIERESVSGWSQVWGLSKPLQSYIARGSIFTYCVNRTELDSLVEWLNKISQNGIGERVQEGFGEVEICSSFHSKNVLPAEHHNNEAGDIE